VESLLTFAEELERRDAGAAEALAALERLQADVEELRVHADAARTFLAAVPVAVAARASDERAAAAARELAANAVRDAEQLVERAERAEKEEQRLVAARALEQARDDLHAAELWLAQAREAQEALEREVTARHAEAERLARRVVELAPRVRDVPTSSPDLGGVLDWASRARGTLMLEHAALAREREEVVREATELLAGVLGEPVAAITVAGVGARLARALAESSS
jgi:hypothetical protein